MTKTVVTKRARPSCGSEALENYSKLSEYAIQGSQNAKRSAQEKGLPVMIMEQGVIYQIMADGHKKSVPGGKHHNKRTTKFEPILKG